MRRRGERRERDGRGRQRNLFSKESSHLFLEKTPVDFPDQTPAKKRSDFYKPLKEKEFYIT